MSLLLDDVGFEDRARARRSARRAAGVTSTNGSRPRTRSRMTSPAAGAWQKPWPEKPVAYRKRPDRPAPRRSARCASGVISYSPAQPSRERHVGQRRRARARPRGAAPAASRRCSRARSPAPGRGRTCRAARRRPRCGSRSVLSKSIVNGSRGRGGQRRGEGDLPAQRARRRARRRPSRRSRADQAPGGADRPSRCAIVPARRVDARRSRRRATSMPVTAQRSTTRAPRRRAAST